MKLRQIAAVGIVVALLGLVPAVPAFAADPASVTGSACGPNEGVTVVVDFLPADDTVAVGCAAGTRTSISAAMIAAGFTVTTEPTAFGNYLCAINSIAANPANCQQFPGPYWSGWINTSDGNPGGPFGTTWTSSNVGVDGGPLPLGTIVGFNQNTDGSFPGPTPRIALDTLPPPDNSPVLLPSHGAASGSATAAAGWIGRQMRAGNGLLNGSAGATVDGIYTLAAAGVGGDQIAQSAAALEATGSSYIGTAAEAPDKFAQVAKLALALQIAGLDATMFPDGDGTRDLLAEIRSVLNADGHFGNFDDPFLHAFALLALSRTVGGAPVPAVDWLEAQQCTDLSAPGAYGFAGCATADPDYTAMAVQGLLAAGVDPADPSVADAVSWLEGQQAADGGIAGNTNSTGLTGQVFAAVGADAARVAAAGFIGGLQVTCFMVNANGGALVQDNVGAIAWKPETLADAQQFGIDDGSLGQWQFATAQAVFGLGTPALGALTAAGATADLPTAQACVEPTSSSTSSTPVPTSSSTAAPTSRPTPAATSTGPVLPSTGASAQTLPELLIAALLVLAGGALLRLTRRPAGDRHR